MFRLRRTRVAGLRREEVDVRCRDGGRQLAEGRDVVEDPERAAVRPDDEVVPVDDEVPDGRRREIDLEGHPGVAVVE